MSLPTARSVAPPGSGAMTFVCSAGSFSPRRSSGVLGPHSTHGKQSPAYAAPKITALAAHPRSERCPGSTTPMKLESSARLCGVLGRKSVSSGE